MQLLELIQILGEEARSSRAELLSGAQLISSLEDAEASEALLEAAASNYADFCGRASAAASSLGLEGLASASATLSEGLAAVSGLPLELRAPVGPLLAHWPDFFMAYLQAWSRGAPEQTLVDALLDQMAVAEFVTPLDAGQRSHLGQLLMHPPLLAEQQAALVPAFEPLSAEALSLALPEDADRSVLESFLSEGPGQVERLAVVVAALGRGVVAAAQLELAHRVAHTLKGTAAMAGVRGIATLAHALEDVLEAYRREDFVPAAGLHACLVAGCEQLEFALEHLDNKTPLPPEFEPTASLLHAWACQLQGIDVPAQAWTQLAPDSATETTAATPVAAASGQAPAVTEAAEEEVQVRIPAKALDKIFRAVNEMAIGLLRLRMQTDDILNRGEAMIALERTANARLSEIERRVTLDGLGRVEGGPQRSSWSPVADAASDAFDDIELDRYNELTGAAQALNESISDMQNARESLMPSLRGVTALAQRQLEFAREAQYQVAQARLRPLSDLRSRLHRTVRQTCSAVGKEAVLEISGDDMRVDAAVLGPLSAALLHLLRNSVDHGLELPDERQAVGKARQGVISVAFTAQGGGVVTVVTDDGKGLDHEAILHKAVWSGLVPAEAQLSRDEIARLIFLPGFSTRTSVTETSGRGVGLDAVAQALSSLQGNVSVKSSDGAGTRFRLFALAAVGTVHALHVEANGEHFLVPSIQLERADAAASSGDLLSPEKESESLPAVWLPELLHGVHSIHDASQKLTRPSLVVDIDGQRRSISVDRIIEAREFLIAPLPALIDRMSGMSGVATLADGSLGVVLDLIDLSRKPLPVHQQGLLRLQSAVQEQLHVLVTDDSASVRNTLSALLRDANYRVTTARDGLDAMRLMAEMRFSLVLTDLEMPQLNGFELTEFIRQRSAQPEVPVIMLTSRGQDKHRTRAAEVGVNTFLVKPYSDQQLLDQIRSAVGAARPLRVNDPLFAIASTA